MSQTQTRAYEVRAADTPLTITGRAVVFDSPAKIGADTEYISPHALDGLDLNGVTLQVNHDRAAIPLARSPKTLALEVTEQGLEMRAQLPDTETGKAVYTAVQRGDLSEMSFCFDIGDSTFDPQTRTRTITAISRIYEISIVNRAAYPQTNIQARNDAQKGTETNMDTTTNFNPITASLDKGVINNDTHATPEYRAAFYKFLLGQELNEAETRAMTAARAERRADAFNTLSNSAAVIPTTTLNEVISQARSVNGLYNEIRLFSVPANLAVPVGTPGDAAAWHIEGEPVNRQDVTTHNVIFSAYELIKVLSMSAAARRMTIAAFESYLTQELRNSISDAIGKAIVSGTGAGQPQGLLSGITWTADNTITASGGTTQNRRIAADDLLAAISKLPSDYAGNAKFAMSTATLFGQLYPLKDAQGQYLFTDTESGGVHRLFGFAIVLDDNLPAGIVFFGNFKYYGLNIPEGVAIEVSRDSGFTSGLIDYRALCIADGKPIVPGAFVKISGAA
jgi:HK97 family phage major capsid protein